MWICFNNAFVSAVENTINKNYLMVRSRDRKHLENIFPNNVDEIYSVPKSDYAWRINVSKKEFADLVAKNIMNINYNNFKNSVEDEDLHDLYLKFWIEGYYYQNYKSINK